jgi:hypothetical protein
MEAYVNSVKTAFSMRLQGFELLRTVTKEAKNSCLMFLWQIDGRISTARLALCKCRAVEKVKFL